MFFDAREIQKGAVIEADICIVGAGAAGITLARELIGMSAKVCLLESGGLEFDLDTQNLYQGQETGYEDYPTDASRMRFFGGTTNHWNGNIWPFFADDFEKRDWIPDSGWPITWQDLDQYYPKAAEIVQIKGPNSWDLETLRPFIQPFFYDSRLVGNHVLDRTVFQHSPPTRFGQVYREDLKKAENVHVYLWANAMGFDARAEGDHVDSIPVKCLNGNTFTVKARTYVLCAGAIENARLLLTSDSVVKQGLGNQNDVVGRYFSDHPLARIGTVLFTDLDSKALELPPQGADKGIRGMLTLSPEALRKHRLNRFVGILAPVRNDSTRGVLRRFWRSAKASYHDEIELTDKVAEVAVSLNILTSEFANQHGWANTQTAYLDIVMEQFPCADSRVTLMDEVDALGMRRTKLNWRFTEDQERALRDGVHLMAAQIGASGLGRMQVSESLDFDNIEKFVFHSSFHHMCTTRMSDDPASGTVDVNCKVHTVDNLFVMGASVFSTGGVSNPTLSIVALTLRLANHLKHTLSLV